LKYDAWRMHGIAVPTAAHFSADTPPHRRRSSGLSASAQTQPSTERNAQVDSRWRSPLVRVRTAQSPMSHPRSVFPERVNSPNPCLHG
jgi:hypothetical protein